MFYLFLSFVLSEEDNFIAVLFLFSESISDTGMGRTSLLCSSCIEKAAKMTPKAVDASERYVECDFLVEKF